MAEIRQCGEFGSLRIREWATEELIQTRGKIVIAKGLFSFASS